MAATGFEATSVAEWMVLVANDGDGEAAVAASLGGGGHADISRRADPARASVWVAAQGLCCCTNGGRDTGLMRLALDPVTCGSTSVLDRHCACAGDRR